MEIKWPWELSRVQHLPLLALGVRVLCDQEQATRAWKEFQFQTLDWISNNPYGLGVNWACPMDIGIRAANFAAAYALFGNPDGRTSPTWRRLFLHSMRQHLRLLQGVLTEDGGNNHATAEAAALYLAAACLPSFLGRTVQLRRAKNVLTQQLRRQVSEDGTQFEGSLYYHLFTLEMWLYTAIVAAAMDDDFGCDYRARLAKMHDVLSAMTSSRLELPQVGDRDDGHLLKPVGAQDDAVRVGHTLRLTERYLHGMPYPSVRSSLWSILLPQDRASQRSASATAKVRTFPDAGWVVIRQDPWQVVLCMGGASKEGGGHTHCDILSFSLFGDGLGFIVDPGTYLYTSDPSTRRLLRSSLSHNQPHFKEIRDRWTSPGCFCHFGKPAVSYAMRRDDEVIAVSAETGNDGWQVRRRVSVPRRSGSVVIEDALVGGKTARIAVCLHPDVATSRIAPTTCLLERGALRLRLETGGFLFSRQPGPFSPRYGSLLETTWLVFEEAVDSAKYRWDISVD
ncbi:MAG: heparinase II/III family protein [Planctomycetota bacterium]